MLGLRLLLPAACCAALIAAPASASAATKAEAQPYSQVHVTSDAPDEANDISAAIVGQDIVIREHGTAALTAGSGCTADPDDARRVTCPLAKASSGLKIDLGPGNDVIRAAEGSGVYRMLHGGDGDDTITGSAGTDSLQGGAGDDTLDGAAGSDTLLGGPGTDTLTFAAARTAQDAVDVTLPPAGATQPAIVTVSPTEVEQLRDLERLVGGPGGDNLVGNSSANVIVGGGGDDYLRGEGSGDLLSGEAGDDTFVAMANDGNDVMDGGTEDWSNGRGDLVFYGNHTTPVSVALPPADGSESAGNGAEGEDDALVGMDSAWGGSAGDLLLGSDARNVILGGTGDDTIGGAGEADELSGGAGVDDISAGAGDDLVRTRDGDDDAEITCDDGADRLVADNVLDAPTRPDGCETIAPQFTGTARLAAAPRVGDTLTVQDLGLTGDAGTVTTLWWSCATAEQDDCAERHTGTSLTLAEADLGRYLYADLNAANAAGEDWSATPSSGVVGAAPKPVDQKPVEEKPVTRDEQETGSQKTGPAPRVDPQPGAAPRPVALPEPVVPPVAADPFAAIARRLLGAPPRAAGAAGAVRLFTAPGRGVAVVCTKGRCRVTAGGRRFTLAAGTGRRVKARAGARVRVAVKAGRRTVRRTLSAR